MAVADLEGQLASLGRSFEFVGRADLLRAVDGQAALPARACVITFDDGLRCQYDLALPVLERAGVPAIFFVCSGPLAEGRALHVHKVHYLRELWSEAEFEIRLLGELASRSIAADVSAEASAVHYRYDTPAAARVKYLLYVALPAERSEAVIDALFKASGRDERDLVAELYMSGREIAELERRSAVGSHAHSHRPLARLGASAVALELERSAAVLDAVTGSRPRLVSYPYGSAEAVDSTIAAAAAAAGFAAGFTMERAINLTLERPLLLARLDTNDALGGRSPLLRVVDGRLDVASGLTLGRRRYLDESSARN